MEKFFMIVSFILTDPTVIDRPLYVFEKPSFNSYSECFSYVQRNNLLLYNKAIRSYNLKYEPEAIYCLNGEAIKDLFKYNYGNPDHTKIQS